MNGTRLGFDIGSGSLKIAVLHGEAVRLETVRLPENLVDEGGGIALPHAFVQFLRQTRKKLRLPRGRAALVLPVSQSICRLVTMPKMTVDQLMINLPYEFSDFIQGAADQYICDYAVCAPTGEDDEAQGVPMMAAVAAKQQLAEYAGMFSRAGIRLCTVLPQEMALVNLTKSRQENTEELFFVDLGSQSTRITVLWRDRVQATRQIPLGGRNLELALAENLGVDAFLAGTYIRSNYHDAQSSAALLDICERIAVEILKVVNFYQFTYRSSELGGVYLAGGGAALEPLRRAITETLEMPLLDPSGLLPGVTENAAAGIFAAGAAMGGK